MNPSVAPFELALLLIGAVISLGNAANWWRSRHAVSGGAFHSRVPLLGAGFAIAACLMHPPWRPFAWVPLILDIGTLELLPQIPAIVRRERRYAKGNRVAEFKFKDDKRQVSFKLLRNDIALLHIRLIPADGELAPYEGGTTGHWRLMTSGQLYFDYEFDPQRGLVFELIEQGRTLECIKDSLIHSINDPRMNLLGARLSACFGTVSTA